jgi:hypothetical protein
MEQVFLKDPDSVMDFSIDWTDWLAPDSDSISTSVWTVDSGITKDSQPYSGAVATVWLSGGTLGESYKCVNTITTGNLRTAQRTIIIKVVQR